jgi:hypothetical protein
MVGNGPVLFGGAVEVPSDVKTGTGLEDDFFYDDAISLDGAGPLALSNQSGRGVAAVPTFRRVGDEGLL